MEREVGPKRHLGDREIDCGRCLRCVRTVKIHSYVFASGWMVVSFPKWQKKRSRTQWQAASLVSDLSSFRSFGQVWLELPGRQLLYRPKLRKDPRSWESKTYSRSVSHGWASPMGYVQHWKKRGQVITLMKIFVEWVWQNSKPGREKEAWRRWVRQLENGLGSHMYFESQLLKFCENLMGFLIKTSLNLWFICGDSTSLYFPNHEPAISSPFI